MCRVCQPILGPYTKAHKESECPLGQASYCSRCGTNRHFKDQCTFKAKMVPFTKTAIPSVKADPAPASYSLANTNEAYVDYCRLFCLPVQGTLELNKATVVNHLEQRNMVLEPLPQPVQGKRRPVIQRKSVA